jgi:hypothetical protein
MLPIACTRCHRPYHGHSAPRPGVRCPVCRGRLAPTPLPVPRADPGSYEEGALAYASVAEFVDEDPRRGPSPERDLGLRWRERGELTFRAAWVRDTGELVLVQTGPPELGGGHVELLGCAPDEQSLRSILAGWEEQCGAADSVGWLRREAAARLEAPVRQWLPARSHERPGALRA